MSVDPRNGDTAIEEGPPRSEASILAAHGITVEFEGVVALSEVDLGLGLQDVLGLIGPNGAGKTTLVNVVTGFQRSRRGKVTLSGTDVTRSPPHKLARTGLARTFQKVRLFRELSVLENVEVGALGVGMGRAEARDWSFELLRQFDLAHRANDAARMLPHGEARRVGIVRALASRPRLVLLDEPTAGMSPRERVNATDTVMELRAELGFGVLIIEHDIELIAHVCDRVQVLDQGKVIAVGTPDEIRREEKVIRAYLGLRKEG